MDSIYLRVYAVFMFEPHHASPPIIGASLDPGKWKMGLAISTDGALAAAGAVRVEPPWTVHRAVMAVLDSVERAGFAPTTWTIEEPRVYRGRGEAAQKEDVKALQGVARRLKKELVPLGTTVRLYAPHAWKGNVPKDVHHRRIAKYLNRRETLLLQQDFRGEGGDARLDVWDAVALELFALGRVGRGGTTNPQTRSKQ